MTVVPHDWPANSKQRSEHNVTVESITAIGLSFRALSMSESKFGGGHSSGNNAGTRRRASLAKQVSGRSLSEVPWRNLEGIVLKTLLPRQTFLNKNWNGNRNKYSRVYLSCVHRNSQFVRFRPGDQIFVKVYEYLIQPPTLSLSLCLFISQDSVIYRASNAIINGAIIHFPLPLEIYGQSSSA